MLRSDPQSAQVLVKDDVVKIQLGAHIDGFAAISGETIVVGASAANPVTGRRADVLKAAWSAAEAAMRTLKVGNKNWAITEIVARTAANWDCKPVEGKNTKTLIGSYFKATLSRNAVLSANTKCHRRKETHHPEPKRISKARLRERYLR